MGQLVPLPPGCSDEEFEEWIRRAGPPWWILKWGIAAILLETVVLILTK